MFSEISPLSQGEGREPYCNYDLEETSLSERSEVVSDASGQNWKRIHKKRVPSRFAFGITENYENSFPCAGFTRLASSKYVFLATPGKWILRKKRERRKLLFIDPAR